MSKRTENRQEPIICVDFDGVVHSYTSGWQGACDIPDPPVPGAFKALWEYVDKGARVCLYSSRSKEPGAIEAMKEWFKLWEKDECFASRPIGWEGVYLANVLEFPTQKPAAWMTIDDRAFCFEGDFPSLGWITRFKPWNKRG